MPGEVEEAGVEAMSARSIGVPVDHHGFDVVVEHLARQAAERQEGPFVARDQRFDALVRHELHIGGPAPAERCDEHRQTVPSPPDRRPIHLCICWPGVVSKRTTGSTTKAVPAERLAIERETLQPIPAPYGSEIVRADLHRAPVPIVGLQHPLPIYDELMLPGACR